MPLLQMTGPDRGNGLATVTKAVRQYAKCGAEKPTRRLLLPRFITGAAPSAVQISTVGLPNAERTCGV